MDHSPEVVIFGAANIDRKAMATGAVVHGSSNPARITSSCGGVGRNIAEAVARLGLSVALISRIGIDSAGNDLLEATQKEGVDCRYVTRSHSSETATYAAMLDIDGSLLLACMDHSIYREITPELIRGAVNEFQKAKIWIVDSNLPTSTLQFIASHCPKGCQLWAIAVSTPMVGVLEPLLPNIDLLLLNEQELDAIAELDAGEGADPSQLTGKGSVLITQGERGATLVESDATYYQPAVPTDVTDTTGAGDSLCAGLLYGYLKTGRLPEALPYGVAAAAITLVSGQTVAPNLSVALLEKIMEKEPHAELV